MAQVRVVVEYSPSDIALGYSIPGQNNISDGSKINVLNDGAMPFLLGASRLGFGDKLWNTSAKYNGFISGVTTSSTGAANVTITITGNGVDRFAIIFDKTANQYATELEVDGEKHTNNLYRFIWGGEPKSSHTIVIRKWNLTLYPVRITSIRVGFAIEYDSSMLQEVKRGSQSMAQNNQPTYGAISQYGNVTFVDKTGELMRLAELGFLKPSLKTQMFFGNLEIGNYTTEKWNYTVNNNKVTVSLNDTVVKWQDKNFDGIDMSENKTAWDVYTALKNATKNETIILGSGAENYIKSIKLGYCELNESKLGEAWNKFCALCQVVMFKDELGKVRIERWI